MNFVAMEPINKGWSGDKKYCATDVNGTRYLLRVSDIAQYDAKQSEFYMMKKVASLGVPMCQPIEFGICEEGVYSVQSWIDGENAELVISGCSDAEQYVFGLEAGRILRRIHSIPAPADQENWEIRFNRKMNDKIRKYSGCPVKYENGQAFIDYINGNRHLLKNRPQVYQHGDYHIGNMMIDRNGQLQIIDFDNNVPMEFWRLLALYISSNTLSSVYWAIPFGKGEVENILNQGKDTLFWYDNMRKFVPTWYQILNI